MANPCTITLTEGNLSGSLSRQIALYETVPVAVTGLVWTAGHTYLALLFRGTTQMGSADSITESVGSGAVLTWSFDFSFTHSALIAACTGQGVGVTFALWDATAERWAMKTPITVQAAAEPTGFVPNDPTVTAATAGQIATAVAACEPDLGNPSTAGYILSSTPAGVRSWVPPTTGSGMGDVTGPAGATAGHVVVLDGTGKVLSDGGLAPADFAAADHDATHAPGGSDALPWTTAHGRGTTVAKPAAAASNAGYLYYDTDLAKLQRSTGSAWEDCAETAGAPAAHAASHTNGGDDIQTATASQKGVMSSAAMTKLDGIEAAADVTDAANIEDAITGSAEETTPATGWKLPVVVSAALKWINWSNIASLFTPAAHAGAAVGSSHSGVGTAAAAATGDFATAAQGTLATNAVPKGTYTTDGGIVVATGTGTYQEETGTTLLASLVAAGAVSAASTNTLTNKTLDSLTNVISADRIHRKVYAGEAIAKGDLVYVSAWNDANACPEVRKARANAVATMPCIGIADAAINVSEVGEVYSAGVVTGLDTSAYSAGTKLYVSSSTAGAWTSTRPVGPNVEQKWGVVGYQHATAGTVSVYLGSTHEFSAADKFWYGGTGGLVTEAAITSQSRTLLARATAALQRGDLAAAPLAAVRHVFWPAGAMIPRGAWTRALRTYFTTPTDSIRQPTNMGTGSAIWRTGTKVRLRSRRFGPPQPAPKAPKP
jgi:hypothetical protein